MGSKADKSFGVWALLESRHCAIRRDLNTEFLDPPRLLWHVAMSRSGQV
jgi:hypothetical protein